MPMQTAHADIFRDWDSVLGACTQNASLIPGVDPFKAELEGFLTQVKDLKIQQETLQGQRLGVTQKLNKAIQDGRESARKVRAFVVVHLGTDNRSLEQFGVKARGSRKKKASSTPPPTVETAGNPQTSQQHNPTVATQGKEETHA